VVPHFQVLTLGPSFSGPAFSCISSFSVPHFQVLHYQSTPASMTAGRAPAVAAVVGTRSVYVCAAGVAHARRNPTAPAQSYSHAPRHHVATAVEERRPSAPCCGTTPDQRRTTNCRLQPAAVHRRQPSTTAPPDRQVSFITRHLKKYADCIDTKYEAENMRKSLNYIFYEMSLAA